MAETYEQTRDRVIRRHRCPCQWPWPGAIVPLTDEELIDLACERGRIAAGGTPTPEPPLWEMR